MHRAQGATGVHGEPRNRRWLEVPERAIPCRILGASRNTLSSQSLVFPGSWGSESGSGSPPG
eukprot:8742125-Pyramimonas_sp.AAC.1